MGKRLYHYEIEERAVSKAHTSMYGCPPANPPDFDESRDSNEQLDALTSMERAQQQQDLSHCTDPAEALIAIEDGAPDGFERRSTQRD